MLILPAIDIIGGKCVRLSQGRFDQQTVYGDPVEQAAAFSAAGAKWIHVVDLEGARAGKPGQHALLRELAAAAKGASIQCGGGVRDKAAAEASFEAGVARVVVGSAAVRRPGDVREWLAAFGVERVCLALDVRARESDYEVAVDAWASGGGVSLFDALGFYPPGSAKHILVTDVARDGELSGPNTELIAAIVRERPDLQVQASGGVSSLADLTTLRACGAAGAIVGRALYEQRFTLEDALAG